MLRKKFFKRREERKEEKEREEKHNAHHALRNVLQKRKFRVIDQLRNSLEINFKININKIPRYLQLGGVLTKRIIKNILNLSVESEPYLLRLTLKNGEELDITISLNTLKGTKILLTEGFHEEIKSFDVNSDETAKALRIGINKISIEKKIKVPRLLSKKYNNKINKVGYYFNYYNSIENIDLRRYQIFHKSAFYNKNLIENIKEMNTQCLIHTLKMCGIEEDRLRAIVISMGGVAHFHKKNLKQVSEIIERKIVLRTFDEKINESRITKFGDFNEQVNIVLYKDHYFIDEKTEYTLSDIDGKRRHGKSLTKLSSYKLIIRMFERGLFIQDGIISCHITSLILDNKNNYEEDSYITESSIKYQIKFKDEEKERKEKKDKKQERKEKKKQNKEEKEKELVIVYADCEAEPRVNECHQLLFIGVCREDSNIPVVYEFDENNPYEVMNNFLGEVTRGCYKKNKKFIVWWHNKKYDFNVLKKWLNIKDIVEKDGQLYSVSILWNKYDIEFRDTYKYFPQSLKNMVNAFDLDKKYSKLEMINYMFHTLKTLKECWVTFEEYARGCKYLTYKEKKYKISYESYIKDWKSIHTIFKENDCYYSYEKYCSLFEEKEETKEEKEAKHLQSLKECVLESKCEIRINKNGEEEFNSVEYYKYYCKKDVMLLREGMMKYNTLLKEKFNVSINDKLTISSAAFSVVEKHLKEVAQVRLNLRHFCSQSIYGGRVQINPDDLKKVIDEEMEDFDSVSNYASAIVRICNELGGFPKGSPKYFKYNSKLRFINNYKTLSTYTYYIAKIRLTKIGKKRKLPIVCIKSKDTNEYINECINQIVIVDKITLEDYINFQDVEFELIEGLYWNEGVTGKEFGESVQNIFDNRLKAKLEGNIALSEVQKNMLVSVFGKTITKMVFDENKIKNVTEDAYNDYMYNNSGIHKKTKKINDTYSLVTESCNDIKYSYTTVGVMILSMAKRIMNEVICLAEDIGCPISYSDTDSMHVRKRYLPLIIEAYEKKYNRKLVGELLGQFHTDFKLEFINNNGEKEKCKNVISKRSIFLGCKSYIDELIGIDKKGILHKGYHFRMKGLSSDAINNKAKELDICIFELYDILAKGKAIEVSQNFDNYHPSFDFCDNGVFTREVGSFIRTLKF